MNKTVSIIITLGLIVGIGIIFWGGSKKESETNNVEIKNGVQYITIKAGGGYSPAATSAQAGIPTKLVVETTGSYDCSSSLVIQSLGYHEILPQRGKTEIAVGTPKAGVPLRGTCSMGMYSFSVNFL